MSRSAQTAGSSTGRLDSLDAYRGFILLTLAADGIIPGVAQRFPTDPTWQFLARQFVHVPWEGCSFWDLISPSFMFMVGAALPYSYAARVAKGDSPARRLAHVIQRSLVLILLGLVLLSDGDVETEWNFTQILTQIGLAYPFAYLLVDRPFRLQVSAIVMVIGLHWLAFAVYPLSPPIFDPRELHVPGGSEAFTGWFAHWNAQINVAAQFDLWFLNLFPRSEPYLFDERGNQTLNFVPKVAVMILGVIVGERMRKGGATRAAAAKLVAAGLGLLVVGLAASTTLSPMVKHLWTLSYTVFGAGWTLLFMAAFLWLVDLQGYRRVAFPLIVVGTNSVAMYCMIHLVQPWVYETLSIHLGEPSWLLNQLLAVASLWVICLWMYRRRLFLRI